jgi:hypothetical protein
MSRNRRMVQIALFAALGLGTATAVVAQPGWTGGQSGPAGRGPAAFSAMDTNGDGYVSADEHAAFRAQRMAANAQAGRLLRNAGNAPQFTDIDADSDGRLSRTEMTQFRDQRMAGRPCNRGGWGGWGWQR